MMQNKSMQIIECHTEGEVGDVIVDGVAPPPGDTLWDQSRWIASDDALRQYVLNEPRGGVFRHCNLLVPPKHPEADIGFIIMEPADTPPMSGSNSICVATVVLETGIVAMQEPRTTLMLEAPGGLVEVSAECKDGHVESVRIRNLPSFAYKLDETLRVPDLGSMTVDVAYGGDTFVIVDADALGLSLSPNNARGLAKIGVEIADAASAQFGFEHPENPDWRHISFCLFATPVEKDGQTLRTKHAVAIRPGKIDRSPTGTGVSARLSVLHAKGEADERTKLVASSIIDSTFIGRIEATARVGELDAIIPSVEGRAWVIGKRELRLDPRDPWPLGYRVSDTWPSD
ncbi:MAG: proline racemase family protein [Gammaproteobacteria bacterium]|nr:proline racemase family protein [Gammaproteobacteria bacterium]